VEAKQQRCVCASNITLRKKLQPGPKAADGAMLLSLSILGGVRKTM
jgi:hypothetical protein